MENAYQLHIRKFLPALMIMSLSMLLLLMINLRYLSSYALQFDDVSLILHSSYFFKVSFVEWITLGYRYYFANYPEAFIEYTNFIRPVVNATIYIESLFSKEPNSFIFLSTNYIGHSIGCVLVYYYSRYIIRLNLLYSLLSTLLFFGSKSVQGNPLYYPAFRGDMLGAIFGMTALLLTHFYYKKIKYKQISIQTIIISLFLLVAVFSKETAIFSTFIVTIYYSSKYMDGHSLIHFKNMVILNYKIFILFLSPALLYLFMIFLFAYNSDSIGAYPLMNARLYINPILTFIQLFFPFDAMNFFKEAVLLIFPSFVFYTAPTNFENLFYYRNIIAFLLNSITIIALCYCIFLKKIQSLITPVIFIFLSMGIPFILSGYPRFMYFGQMFSIPVFVYLLNYFYDNAKQKKYCEYNSIANFIIIILIFFALVINPVYLISNTIKSQDSLIKGNYQSIAIQESLAEEIKNPDVKRVYYINDTIYWFGSLSLLEMVAKLNNRSDLSLRVVNTLSGYNPMNTCEGVIHNILSDFDDIKFQIIIEDNMDFHFPGAFNAYENLGVPDFIEYEFNHGNNKIMSFSIPNYSKKDFLIIGFDPCNSGIYKYDINKNKWIKLREIY
jgi:hypothetical protein